MMYFHKIDWAPSETLFTIGSFGIHIYSLMFVCAFALGYYLIKKIYEKEKVDVAHIENLFVYMIISVFLGARLGDVFFYSWDYYQDHLIEILLPIRETADGFKFIGFRGLASHGAVIGVFIGLFLYQYKYSYKPILWILDRICIPVSIGASFVRIGNFFNSEIVGKYTNTNFGVVFLNNGDTLPRHPAQLYEALGYFMVFLLIQSLYRKGYGQRRGFLVGIYFTCSFIIRFLVEFVKASQGGFEEVLPMLSTGQWLSIPFILLGLYFIIRSLQIKSVQG